MFRRHEPFVVPLLALLLLAPPLFAAQTGEIRGSLAGEDGLAVAGGVVTVTSASLQGERRAVSNDDGFFRVPLLPIGSYELRIELAGYETIRLSRLEVRLGQTTVLPIVLKRMTVEESVTVTADPPLVDRTSADTSYRLGGKELARIPTQARTIAEVVGFTPGVTGVRHNTETGSDTGLPSFRGEGGAGNNWLVDGLSTKGVNLNDPGVRVNFDAWDEVQVVSDGFAPEYGQTLGGVINVVTKSGGNSFEGTVGALVRPDSFRSSRKEQLSSASLPETALGEYYANVGGPILDDRLRYFLSDDFRTAKDRSSEQEVGWLSIPGGSRTERTNGLFGKLTFAPLGGHTLSLSGTWDSLMDESGGIGVPETYPRNDFDDSSMRLNYLGVVGPRLVVTAVAGFNRRDHEVDPASGDYGPASHFWYDIGQRTNNIERGSSSAERRRDLAVSGSWWFDLGGAGSHEIKAGLSYYDNSFRETWRWTGSDADLWPDNGFDQGVAINWAAPGQPMGLVEYRTGRTDDSTDGYGLHLQDSITWPRLSLMIGLRTDTQKVSNDLGEEVWSWGMGDFIQPRLSLAFDLTGDGRTLLKAAYGEFAMPIANQYLTWVNRTWLVSFRNYAWVGPGDPTEAQLADAGNWELLWEQSNGGTPMAVDPELEPNRTRRILVGIEQRIGTSWAAKLRGIWSESNDLLEDVALYDPDSPFGFSYRFTNFGAKTRDYRAIELEVNGRPSDRLAVDFSYTWSKAKGATSGNAWENGGGYDGGPFGDNPDMPADHPDAELYAFLFGGLGGTGAGDEGWYGELPYSVDHVAKLLATARAPWSIDVSAAVEWLSGYHWEKRGLSNGYGAYLTYPEGRGSRETPSHTYVDLAVSKSFTLGEGISASLGCTVYNLFNSQVPVSYVHEDSELFGAVWARQLPRWAQLTASVSF